MKIEEFLQTAFREDPKGSPQDCPEPLSWISWLDKKLELQEEENLMRHALHCARCTEILWHLAKNQKDWPFPSGRLPKDLEKKLNGWVHKRFSSWAAFPWRKWVWPVLFIFFMGLSFAMPGYFLQMLVLALFCGARGLLNALKKPEWHVHITQNADPGDRTPGERRHLFFHNKEPRDTSQGDGKNSFFGV